MSPATFVWNPPPVPSVPVRGKTERLPTPKAGIVIENGELAYMAGVGDIVLHIGPAE